MDSLGSLALQRFATTELRLVPADHPTESCLERRDPGAEFVAMERKPCLEAQGVACTEPCWVHTGSSDCVPESRCSTDRHGNLHPVLTGVAGAGNGARNTLPTQFGHPEPADVGRLRKRCGQ